MFSEKKSGAKTSATVSDKYQIQLKEVFAAKNQHVGGKFHHGVMITILL